MNLLRPRAFAAQLVLAALAFIGTAGGLGFSIVDARREIAASADRTRRVELRVAELERLAAATGGTVAAASSPEVLAQRNQELALGLVPPAEARVVRVAGSPERRLAAKRNSEIFAAGRETLVVPLGLNSGGALPR
jgi:hypothetical protein